MGERPPSVRRLVLEVLVVLREEWTAAAGLVEVVDGFHELLISDITA